MAGARRRILASSALAAGATLLALALCEVAIRVTWPLAASTAELQADRVTIALDARREGAKTPVERAIEEHGDLPILRSLADLTRKNVRGLYKGTVFRTNGAGFRGPDLAVKPAPGVFRIAVTGDSVTMGAGVEESETYAAQLEALLDAGGDGVDYQVLNLGLGGIPISHAVRRLQRIGMRFHPRLIVYGFTPNDIELDGYRSTISAGRLAEQTRSRQRLRELPLYLPRVVWPRIVDLARSIAPPPGTYEYDLHYNYFENPAVWGEFTRWLDRFAQLAVDEGICAHVLIHTTLVELGVFHDFHDVYEKVGRAARERGLSVTDPFEALRGRRAVDLWVHPGDSHPNAEGHAIFARALHDDLRALPSRCWRARTARR